jgi:hypothetical protein
MSALGEFKGNQDKRFDGFEQKLEEIQNQADRLEEVQNRPTYATTTAAAARHDRFAVTVSGKQVPVLAREDQLSNHFRAQPNYGEPEFSIGDFVRASMGVGNRNASILERGSATVPTFLTSRIIDDIRAKNTLVQSGALTLGIDAKTVISRIDSDPTCYVHQEGETDITESVPAFSPVTLDPPMLVCQVPLSVEIVADSENLDLLLRTSISAAIAKKLDQTGISILLSDSAIEESATGQDTETWAGLLQAASSHIALDGDWPKAVISNAADYGKRISQISGDGDWLVNPPPLATMKDLFSTHMTAGKAIMGNPSQGLLLCMRQELRLELIRWQKPGSATHLLIAYMRGGFYITQSKALYRMLKTVI